MNFSDYSKKFIKVHNQISKLNNLDFSSDGEMAGLKQDIMSTRGDMNNFLDTYREQGVAVFDNKMKLTLNGQTSHVIDPIKSDIEAALKESMPENSFQVLDSKTHDMVILVDSRNNMSGAKLMDVMEKFQDNHSIDEVTRTSMIPSPSGKDKVFDLKSAHKLVQSQDAKLAIQDEFTM